MSEDKKAAAEAAAMAVKAVAQETKSATTKEQPKAEVANAMTAGPASMTRVYCKIPHGLRFPGPDGKKYTINGSLHPEAFAGYGVTAMDPEIWKHFSLTQRAHPMVVKGLIFEAGSEQSGRDMAREREAERTGFEARTQEGAVED